MSPAEIRAAAAPGGDRIDKLIERLPLVMQTGIRWLRRPSSGWARIPAGVLLVGGGLLSILPVFGLWMLPLGAILLADDVPALRQARDRILDVIERYRPHWFARPATSNAAASAGAPSWPANSRGTGGAGHT
jgi:hypothetical protein